MNRILSYVEAVREATAQEMALDERVMLIGQGVDDHKGINGTTLGLVDMFGSDRVLDTPLAEDGVTGIAIGLAMGGMRPIQTHIRMDFLLLAMNQLVNMAAKSHYMFGGQISVPLVVRSLIGRSWGQGAQHSQGLHSLLMHIPGIKVVAPSTPYDAKGCLIAAIRDENPTLFVEHRMLHFQRGPVPEETYTVPFGKARILKSGRDVTLVGISYMAVECLRAHALLAETGVDAEVIDPVSLSPLDIDTIAASVMKTGRLVVVDTAWTNCGAGAEIITQVMEQLEGIRGFRARRLGFAPVPCPTTRPLEDLFYPNPETIATTAFRLVDERGADWSPDWVQAPEIVQFKGPF